MGESPANIYLHVVNDLSISDIPATSILPQRFAPGGLQNTFCLFFSTGAVSDPDPLKAESCKMIVEMCTAIYKGKLNDSATDNHVCLMLRDYKRCLERSARTCAGDSPYDTLITVVSRLLHRLCLEHNQGNLELEKNSLLI